MPPTAPSAAPDDAPLDGRARCRARGARGGRHRAGRHRAGRAGGDGRGGRRGDGRRAAPAGAGRHGHRQVAGLPGAQPAARRAGRGRDRDARAAAPAGRARHPAAGRGDRRPGRRVVRRAQGPLQLRVPAPDPRGRPRRPGGPGRDAVGLDGPEGPRAAGLGRGGGRVGRQRRARQRAAPHRPRVAAGQRRAPRLPGRGQVPLRPGVLRRAGPGEGAPLPPDRHQPLAARDRRDRGRADDPRLRRGGHRRGARAHRPGDPGRHRRAGRGRRRAGGPPLAAVRGRLGGRRPRRRGRHAARRDARRDPGRFERIPQQLADALVLVRDAARACLSAYPKEGEAATPTPAAPRRKGSVQEVFAYAERMAADLDSDVLWMSEGGVPGEGQPDPATALRRTAAGVGTRCATSCSPTRPSSSPRRR